MRRVIISGLMATVALTASAALFAKDSPDEQRAEIRKMRDEVLAQLYETKPETRAEINKAVGYAVFDNWGIKILLLGTERGKGLAHDSRAGKDIFMKMFSGGAGLGVGVSDFRAVFVFHTPSSFDDFVESGWDFSGEAEASAKADDKGATGTAAESVGNVSVYQFTKTGLALKATLSGTKYWKNDDLN